MTGAGDADVALGATGRCVVRYPTGRCPHGAVPGLPVCGPCLTLILSEPDPGRRRSLAGLPGIPAALVARLVSDPDPGVRAEIAGRDRLDPGMAARLADPGDEPAPLVWRALAATATGAALADRLLGTGDRATALILATNPMLPDDVAAGFLEHDDARLAATVAATRQGRPPEAAVGALILDARANPTRPLAEAPPGSVQPHRDTDHGPASTTASPDRPASHRILVAGFFVVLALIVAAAVIIITQGGGNDRQLQAIGPAATAVTLSPARTSPGTGPATDDGSATPVMLTLTISSGDGRFCDAVDLRIDYEAVTEATVVVTDDDARVLFDGVWQSGATHTVQVTEPSEHLHAELTTDVVDPDDFQPSGTVSGNLC